MTSSIPNDLASALKSGRVEYVSQVESDVLRHWRDGEYGNALAMAAAYGSLSCCEEIFRKCPSLLYENRNGCTPLHEAAHSNRQEVIKFLLSASVTREACGDIESASHDNNNMKLLTMVTDIEQITALHKAVEDGHLESAKLLIKADPSNNLLGMVQNNGDTAMHIAVKKHNLGIVKLLIGVDPDFEYCPNVMSQTPLYIAFQEGLTGDETTVKIRKLLMEKQPNQCKVPTGSNNWTLLHHAAHKGDLSTVEDIIKFCPECLQTVDINKQNFLHIAVKCENNNVVKYILESSTYTEETLNGQDNHGNTPLHIAAIAHNAIIASFFLYNSRVSKEIRNMQGQRAIDLIHFEYDKRKAGVYGLVDRVGEKDIKDQTDFDLLVGALIATVSFTAGITVPGGYTSDGRNEGTAVLAKKLSFKVFVIANVIALLLSLYAVFCHFCVKHLRKKENIINRLNVATYCLFGSIFAMVVAFITGSYVVLSVTEEFSITVCVLCCCFFLFAFHALWEMLMEDKPSLFRAWK